MMTANEARMMTDKAIENEIATRKQRAEEFCEEAAKEIAKRCEMRKREMTVEDIPNGLYNYVIGIFKDYGYTVTQLNNLTIQISW
jgi:hypothetical protein